MNDFWNIPSDEILTAGSDSDAVEANETTDPHRLPRMMKLLEEFKGFVRDAIDAECDGQMDDLTFLEACVEVFRDNYPFDEEETAMT